MTNEMNIMQRVVSGTLMLMLACNSSAADGNVEGRFVWAGPVNAIAKVVSVSWRYGLLLNVEPQEILEVKFSCDPIPGTTFSVKSSELKRAKDGALFVEGPALPMSKETTGWLFDLAITSAECSAVVSTSNQRQAVFTSKVRFSRGEKAALVQQMEVLQKLNQPTVLSKDWKIGHSARNAEEQIREYVLPGQTVHDWAELLTLQVFAAPAGVSLSRLLETSRQGFGADCKDLHWTVVKQTDDEVLYAWSHAGCDKYAAQAERALITKMPKRICRWSYTTKSPPLTREVEVQLDAELAAMPCN